MVGEGKGFGSIPQHGSISGKVNKIDRFLHSTGRMRQAIQITSDGKDEWGEFGDEEGC